MGFLAGKRALIVGVATDRSIAWGIAEAMHREGAELAFTYANERFKDRVEPLAASIGSDIMLPLEVTSDAEIDAAFAALGERWDGLDILVHAVAFAPREALAGGFTASTSREAFAIAHDVSSYSLTALARGAHPGRRAVERRRQRCLHLLVMMLPGWSCRLRRGICSRLPLCAWHLSVRARRRRL
jgi:enoyl-[acyl-carrier protein] reductase I